MCCCNIPPCLRDQLFLKSVVMPTGIVGLAGSVSVYLQDIDSIKGWILESMVDQQVEQKSGHY